VSIGFVKKKSVLIDFNTKQWYDIQTLISKCQVTRAADIAMP